MWEGNVGMLHLHHIGMDFRSKLGDVVGVMQLFCFMPFIPLAKCSCIGAGAQEFLAYLRAESPDYLAACY